MITKERFVKYEPKSKLKTWNQYLPFWEITNTQKRRYIPINTMFPKEEDINMLGAITPATDRYSQTRFRKLGKRGTMRKVGIRGVGEMPTFGELAFGNANLPALVRTAPSRRNVWGFLQGTATDNNLGDLWTDIANTGNTLLKTAGDIYATYQTGQIAKTQAEIAQAQAKVIDQRQPIVTTGGLMSYVPWILGIGGVSLLAYALTRKRR